MTRRAVAAKVSQGRLLVLRARRDGDELRVESAAAFDLEAEGQDAEQVRDALAAGGFLGWPTALSLPSSSAFAFCHRPRVADRAAVRRTLRYEVEDRLPIAVDELTLDFAGDAGLEENDGRVVVAAVREEEAEAAAATLSRAGLPPLQVTVDCLVVTGAYSALGVLNGCGRALCMHCGPDGVDVIRTRGGYLEDVRGIPAAHADDGTARQMPPLLRCSVEEAVLSDGVDRVVTSGSREARGWLDEACNGLEVISLGGAACPAPVEGLSPEERELVLGPALPLVGAAAALLGLPTRAPVNLLDAEGQLRGWAETERTPLLVAAVLLVLLALLWAAGGAARLARAQRRHGEAGAGLLAAWQELKPGAPVPVDPVRAVRSEVSARRLLSDPSAPEPLALLDSLAALASALPADAGALAFTRILATPEGVTVEGRAGEYGEVDQLVRALAERGFRPAAPEMSARAGDVQFRVALRRADADE